MRAYPNELELNPDDRGIDSRNLATDSCTPSVDKIDGGHAFIILTIVSKLLTHNPSTVVAGVQRPVCLVLPHFYQNYVVLQYMKIIALAMCALKTMVVLL